MSKLIKAEVAKFEVCVFVLDGCVLVGRDCVDCVVVCSSERIQRNASQVPGITHEYAASGWLGVVSVCLSVCLSFILLVHGLVVNPRASVYLKWFNSFAGQ